MSTLAKRHASQVDRYYHMTIENLKDTLPHVVDHFLVSGAIDDIILGLQDYNTQRLMKANEPDAQDLFVMDESIEMARRDFSNKEKFFENSLSEMEKLKKSLTSKQG